MPTPANADIRTKPFLVEPVTTGGPFTINVPDEDVLVAHLGVQDDGTTPSVATDYVVVMNQSDAMVASLAPGTKMVVFSGGVGTFRGGDVSVGSSGQREIHIQAVGHGATVQLIKGYKIKE